MPEAARTCLHCFSDGLDGLTMHLISAEALDELLHDLPIWLQPSFHSLSQQGLTMLQVPGTVKSG